MAAGLLAVAAFMTVTPYSVGEAYAVDTDPGTLSGSLITQLRRITKVNSSATTRPIIIPCRGAVHLRDPSQLGDQTAGQRAGIGIALFLRADQPDR
jgi:hypothetical protein